MSKRTLILAGVGTAAVVGAIISAVVDHRDGCDCEADAPLELAETVEDAAD